MKYVSLAYSGANGTRVYTDGKKYYACSCEIDCRSKYAHDEMLNATYFADRDLSLVLRAVTKGDDR